MRAPCWPLWSSTILCIGKSVRQRFPKAALTLKVRDREDVTWEVIGHRESSLEPWIPLREREIKRQAGREREMGSEIYRHKNRKARVECLMDRGMNLKTPSYCGLVCREGNTDTHIECRPTYSPQPTVESCAKINSYYLSMTYSV